MSNFIWKQEVCGSGFGYSRVVLGPIEWNRDVDFVPDPGPWQRNHKLPYAPEEPFYTHNFPPLVTGPSVDPPPREPFGPPIPLFARLGLHCYNLQKGTDLQFVAVHKIYIRITSICSYLVTLEVLDPIRNSCCEFETDVRHAVENIDCLSAIITRCSLTTPQTSVEEGLCYGFNKDVVDFFFKGAMPEWMPEGALTETEKLQCYEMKESEVEEEKEWLHLYAELALFSLWQSKLEELESAKPFDLRKIIVRTKEDVEPKKKVKAENAIFYISFKTRCGQECYGIIRKTTDGMPEHLSLEVKCLM
ncbi:Protein MS5 [Arabidopsis suecica]|uniref:Protein MS5 n=1 Tax=Arabidopsis suecica TaxID=45249 RepID=A0A8T2AIN7_ARASU|nr:Protein MS5 [Arabidopsis suecica]